MHLKKPITITCKPVYLAFISNDSVYSDYISKASEVVEDKEEVGIELVVFEISNMYDFEGKTTFSSGGFQFETNESIADILNAIKQANE